MLLLHLVAAELQQHSGTGGERGHLDPRRVFVTDYLLVESTHVLVGETLAAVLRREDDPGKAAVEQHALKITVVLDDRKLLLIGEVAAHTLAEVRSGLGHVVGQPAAGALAKVLYRFDLGVAHAASPCAASRRSVILRR